MTAIDEQSRDESSHQFQTGNGDESHDSMVGKRSNFDEFDFKNGGLVF